MDDLRARGLRTTCTGHLTLSNLEDNSGSYFHTAYNMRVWEYASVFDLCQLGPAVRVLDAGGASSIIDFYAASLGAQVVSIDLQADLVYNASQVARSMGWSNLVAERMDLTDLRFPDASFDAVVSISVLEHLPDALKRRAIEEFARVVKPGGLVGLTFDFGEPVGEATTYKYDLHDQAHSPLRNDADVERLFLQVPTLQPLGGRRERPDRIEVDLRSIRRAYLYQAWREPALARRLIQGLKYALWRRWVNPYFRYTFCRLILERGPGAAASPGK